MRCNRLIYKPPASRLNSKVRVAALVPGQQAAPCWLTPASYPFTTGGGMHGVVAVDPGSAAGTVLAPDAEAALGGFTATRQWGFASDERAALMVCLHSADILVVA